MSTILRSPAAWRIACATGVSRIASAVVAIPRETARAVRAHAGLFLLVTGALVMTSVMLPPIVLSLARKPWTYFAFNPWLKNLPPYLISDRPPGEKLDFLSRAALFWFSADGAYGAPEWAFAVDTLDVARMVAVAAL